MREHLAAVLHSSVEGVLSREGGRGREGGREGGRERGKKVHVCRQDREKDRQWKGGKWKEKGRGEGGGGTY